MSYQHLRLQDVDDVVVVYFQNGSIIDQGLIDQIGNELTEAALEASGNHKLLVNFQGVKFMASAMLGKLLPLHKRCKNDKIKLKLCNISANLMEVFKITNLNKVFEISDTEATAVAAFKKRGLFG